MARQFDVCLSFAGEDRPYVDRVAAALTAEGFRVFYDAYAEAQLWGKQLFQHLADIYQHQSEYCIVFISRHYASKTWPKLELQAAQARALSESEYLLFARFDDTELPGVLPTIGYIDLRHKTPTQLAELFAAKARSAANTARPVDNSALPVPASSHDQFTRLAISRYLVKHIPDADAKARATRVAAVDSNASATSKNLRLALVSMPIFAGSLQSFSLNKGHSNSKRSDELLRLFTLSDSDGKSALRAFREGMITALGDFGAHAVCANELGLPSAEGSVLSAAKRFAHSQSKEHNALIVAGTSHDTRTFFNTGYVFQAGGPAAGYQFHKHTTDSRSGEAILTPPSATIPVALVNGFRVAIVVGADLLDYACVSAITELHGGIDILLIPSYTQRMDRLADMAKVVSSAIAGIAIVVNGAWPQVARHYVAKFGETAWVEEERVLASGSVVSWLQIDERSFRTERVRCRASEAKGVDRIFRRSARQSA